MFSSFLGRVLGYPPSDASSQNSNMMTSASSALADAASGCAAPRLRVSDSTQYRATTRPYHCSQNQVAGAHHSSSSTSAKADIDGTSSSSALERLGTGSTSSRAYSPAVDASRPPKLVLAVPRSGAESSVNTNTTTPLAANATTFHLNEQPPRVTSASSTGLDALSTSSAGGGGFATPTTSSSVAAVSTEHARRFKKALHAEPMDVGKLRELSWQGCPVQLRYEAWMFLTGSWSAQASTRASTVSRRRMEYATYIHSSYGIVDWDAVCALVDSGVDTAVHRSTLKAVDTATPCAFLASFSSSGAAALEVPLPELAVTASASSRTPLQASPLTPAFASPEASDVIADDSLNTTATTSTHLMASPKQMAGSDSRTTFTPILSSPTTVNASAATSTGHQLSASTMLGTKELQTLKQIRKDIPRMSGGRCYLRHPRVQGSIERVLFIWSLRHPACGYVQGMNDLVVPFMAVVLAYHFCPTRSITELQSYTGDIFEEIWSLTAVPVAQWINEIEAEVYWLTSYLLNTMQDNYTSSHEGITAMMRHLAAVVQAADPPLYHRMVDTLQLHFEYFSFRWMNCLLLRELTETQSLLLLDAYLSDEERRWSVTHVYVCAALLLRWSPQLLSFGDDYISALKFLQAPPTERLSLRDFQDVLSESFVLQNLYEASLSRLVLRTK